MTSRHTVHFLHQFAWALTALAGLFGGYWLVANAAHVFAWLALFGAPLALLTIALFRGGK